MKRYLIMAMLALLFIQVGAPISHAEIPADFYPIRTGMRLKFMCIFEHVIQKEKIWELTVVKTSFPESLTYTWNRPGKDKEGSSGTRILTDLKYSRDFNPWYKENESKATTDTAPWLAQEVLKELLKKEVARNFKEGGAGAINWAAVSLKIKEYIVFPIIINGKPEVVHAFKLNKGLTVWNNPNNPLVVEYEPLGIPILTSLTGWKLVEINY